MNSLQALALADVSAQTDHEPHTTALADRLSDGQANSLYATAYQLAERGKHEKANSLFALLGMYCPQEPKYPHAAGVCFRKLGQYEDAIRMFARAQQLDPDNHDPAFQVVECMLLLGRREAARDLLLSMIEIARRDAREVTLERAEAMLSFLEAPVQ
jgi:type III secretion system low calcium response chaperone LcrH/SycD